MFPVQQIIQYKQQCVKDCSGKNNTFTKSTYTFLEGPFKFPWRYPYRNMVYLYEKVYTCILLENCGLWIFIFPVYHHAKYSKFLTHFWKWKIPKLNSYFSIKSSQDSKKGNWITSSQWCILQSKIKILIPRWRAINKPFQISIWDILMQSQAALLNLPIFWLICLICLISTLQFSLISTLCKDYSQFTYKQTRCSNQVDKPWS